MSGNSAVTTVALVALRAGVSVDAGIAGEDCWAFSAGEELGARI